jgi:hypothetical protein
MKAQPPRFRLIRRGGRKKSRVKGGWRALTIYLLVVTVMGLAVIALGLNLEQRERALSIAPR